MKVDILELLQAHTEVPLLAVLRRRYRNSDLIEIKVYRALCREHGARPLC
jgi:hypothetical protein